MQQDAVLVLEKFCAERIDLMIPGLLKLVKQYKELQEALLGMCGYQFQLSSFVLFCCIEMMMMFFFKAGLEKAVKYIINRPNKPGGYVAPSVRST
jgi:hypothetical protein